MITKILVWVQAILSLLVIVRIVNNLDPWCVILTYWAVNALKNTIEGMKSENTKEAENDIRGD